MPDIANIFLFNDLKKVRIGVERPSNYIVVPTTDPENREFNLSINDNLYEFRYPYGWNIPQDTVFTEGNIEYTFQTQGFMDIFKIIGKSK